MGKLTQAALEEAACRIVARRPRVTSIAEFLLDLQEWTQLGLAFRYGLSHIRSVRDFGDGLLIASYPIVSSGGVLTEYTPVCAVYHQRLLAQTPHGLIPLVLTPRASGLAIGLSAAQTDALTSAAMQSFRGYNRQLRQRLVEVCGLPRRKAHYVDDRNHARVVQ